MNPDRQTWVGRPVKFDLQGKRATGTVTAVKDNGVRGPGAVPDYLLAIRGGSGRVVEVSMFDTYAVVE